METGYLGIEGRESCAEGPYQRSKFRARCVATVPDSGVATISVASALRVAATSGSNVVTVPMAIAVRAASSGFGVEVP